MYKRINVDMSLLRTVKLFAMFMLFSVIIVAPFARGAGRNDYFVIAAIFSLIMVALWYRNDVNVEAYKQAGVVKYLMQHDIETGKAVIEDDSKSYPTATQYMWEIRCFEKGNSYVDNAINANHDIVNTAQKYLNNRELFIRKATK